MNLEEYKEKIKIEEDGHQKEIFSIMREFALSNNKVKVGDKISDHYSSIIVEQIRVTRPFTAECPECFYKGVRITKTGVPFKSGEKHIIYQSNIVEDK